MSLVKRKHATPQNKSDHFNGKKFFNPTLEQPFSPGFSDVIRMMREGRPAWPKWVENTGKPSIDVSLGSDDINLTFVNHATFLIQLPTVNILTDPVWAKRVSPISWLGPKRVRPPGIAIDDLPRIDVILVSHNHYDHLDAETLKKLEQRFSPLVIVPLGDKILLESLGVKRVVELDWWQDIEVTNNLKITFTPTQHSSARGLFDRDKSLWGSFYIRFKERSIYFGGDAGYSSHFKDTKRRLGSPEIAILGIGAYAPRFFMQAIHMNPAEAVLAHKDLEAKLSIGMHFGTFQLASETFDDPLQALDIALQNEGVNKQAFTTLNEGESQYFPNERSHLYPWHSK